MVNTQHATLAELIVSNGQWTAQEWLPSNSLELDWFTRAASLLFDNISAVRSCAFNDIPYQSFEELHDDYHRGHINVLTNGHPLGEVYDKYRAWHDIHHCQLTLGFTLEDELSLADYALYKLGNMNAPRTVLHFAYSDIALANVVRTAPNSHELEAHWSWDKVFKYGYNVTTHPVHLARLVREQLG